MLSLRVYLDLGSANLRLQVEGKEPLEEPSLLALECSSESVRAVGSQAAALLGVPLQGVRALYPLREGLIQELPSAQALLRCYLRQLSLWRRLRVRALLPAHSTPIDRYCWRQLLLSAGAGAVELAPAPLAAALGAEVDMKLPGGFMVIDLGAGLQQYSILSQGEILLHRFWPGGGEELTRAVGEGVRREYNLLLAPAALEEVKRELLAAVGAPRQSELTVNGYDLLSGLPQERRLESRRLRGILAPFLERWAQEAQEVLRETPCELAADLVDNGLLLVGGGALLSGLGQYFQERLGLPVKVASEPGRCALAGAPLVAAASLWAESEGR